MGAAHIHPPRRSVSADTTGMLSSRRRSASRSARSDSASASATRSRWEREAPPSSPSHSLRASSQAPRSAFSAASARSLLAS